MVNWAGRAEKYHARKLAVSGGVTNHPKHRALMLPASKALDVSEALSSGVFTHDTALVAVERDPLVFDKMVQKLKTEPLGKLEFFNSELHEVKLRGLIDFAFLDFCGSFTRQNVLWISTYLSPALMNTADISITISKGPRNAAEFMDRVHKFCTSRTDRRMQIEQIFKTTGLMTTYIQMLEFIFHGWDFDIIKPLIEYNDGVDMLLFLCRSFHRSKPVPKLLGNDQSWHNLVMEIV